MYLSHREVRWHHSIHAYRLYSLLVIGWWAHSTPIAERYRSDPDMSTESILSAARVSVFVVNHTYCQFSTRPDPVPVTQLTTISVDIGAQSCCGRVIDGWPSISRPRPRRVCHCASFAVSRAVHQSLVDRRPGRYQRGRTPREGRRLGSGYQQSVAVQCDL